MAHEIYLKLDGSTIMWSADGTTNWQTVTRDSPSTGVDQDDEIDWIAADDSIQKIKIMPPNGVILDRVNGNDTKNPKGKTKSSIPNPSTEKYEIWVLPNPPKGGYIKVDPEIHYPPS